MDELSPHNTLYGVSCHIDHQPSRTIKFNRFEGVCFDPDLAAVAHLFTVHRMKEDEMHVSAAFSYLKSVLHKNGKQFLPHEFVRDGERY